MDMMRRGLAERRGSGRCHPEKSLWWGDCRAERRERNGELRPKFADVEGVFI